MSFQQGLSGLTSSARNLDVIGHNIANANTVGMKASRTEFSELVAASGSPSGTMGMGVTVGAVAQQFNQGGISTTGNSLDVAINGKGFFQVKQADGTAAYTRAGNFKMDDKGNLVTNNKNNVMGYATDPVTGMVTSRAPTAITLPTASGIPGKATRNDPTDPTNPAIKLAANLDANAPVYDRATNTPPYTTYGTSLNVYDSLGNAIPVSIFFTKTGPNTWDATGLTQKQMEEIQYPTTPFPGTGTALGSITFRTTDDPTVNPPLRAGDIDGLPFATGTWTIDSPVSGEAGIDITPNLDSLTQYGARFSISSLTQNGYAAGELTSVSIEDSGLIAARYSNGKTFYQGKLAMASFTNEQGLQPMGAGNWIETKASGTPTMGEAGVGSLGTLRSGALEDSNVDLTAELVNMMTAQRAYQANAQTIKTQDQVMTTLVNMR